MLTTPPQMGGISRKLWTIEHTQQVSVYVVLIDANDWIEIFGIFANTRLEETDLPYD